MSEETPDSMDLDDSIGSSSEEEFFNKERTMALINLFKKYKPMVAAGSIKTMKQMWEIISVDLTNQFQIPFSVAKCENRFKVLERGYKKMKEDIVNGKQRKRFFQYFEEFKDLYTRKYILVPGLNSKNYADFTSTNFGNTLTTIISNDLCNVKSEITANVDGLQQQIKGPTFEGYFNREKTLALIKLYKKYNQQVNDGLIKTKKKMWSLIAKELLNLFHIPISAGKCENKLKVLERVYKKGTFKRKRFLYEAELKEIFGNQESDTPPKIPSQSKPNQANASTSTVPQQVTIRVLDPKPQPINKIEMILLDIRCDFQNYYKEKLNIEREKLSIEREKLALEKEKFLFKKVGKALKVTDQKIHNLFFSVVLFTCFIGFLINPILHITPEIPLHCKICSQYIGLKDKAYTGMYKKYFV